MQYTQLRQRKSYIKWLYWAQTILEQQRVSCSKFEWPNRRLPQRKSAMHVKQRIHHETDSSPVSPKDRGRMLGPGNHQNPLPVYKGDSVKSSRSRESTTPQRCTRTQQHHLYGTHLLLSLGNFVQEQQAASLTSDPSAGLLRVLSPILFFPKSLPWDNRKQLWGFEGEEKGKTHEETQVCGVEWMACLEGQDWERAGWIFHKSSYLLSWDIHLFQLALGFCCF